MKKCFLAGFTAFCLLVFGCMPAGAEGNEETWWPPGLPKPLNSYLDMSEDLWHYEAINFLRDRLDLPNDESYDYFCPNKPIPRGVVVQIIARALHSAEIVNILEYNHSGFADVDDAGLEQKYESDAEHAIAWARESGIIAGYGNGNFGFEDPITREQTAVILIQLQQYLDIRLEGDQQFTDMDTVSVWAKEAVSTLAANDVICGYPDGSFCPKQTVTKAECAQLIYNFLQTNKIDFGFNWFLRFDYGVHD